MSTSLITRIGKNSLLTFKSSIEDIELFNRTDKKFSFSNFALLNLPSIKKSINNQNVMDFSRIQSRMLTGDSTLTPPSLGDTIDLSESFQNYVNNFEELLTIRDSYDINNLRTTSERVFMKWLKEIGAIRFKSPTYIESNYPNDTFIEEQTNNDITSGNIYNKVFVYIGEIEMQNKNVSNKNNFEEVYIHIPSDAGSTPIILFQTIDDNNYSKETYYQKSDVSSREYIEGFDSTSPSQPNGLELLAQYDIDVQGLTYSSINQQDTTDTTVWHSYFSGEDAYLTDREFTDPTNDLISVVNPTTNSTETFLRSRLDGITIDFNTNHYTDFNGNVLKSFNEYNRQPQSTSFEFNAIAIYYEVEFNGQRVKNLYGVLFLDDVSEIVSGESKILPIPKIKTSTILNTTGNSFGFKMNFKPIPATTISQPDVVMSVNDYNTFSMELFMDAMNRMNEISINYEKVLLRNQELIEKNEGLINIITSQNDDRLNSILNEINQKLVTNQQNVGIIELIEKNSNLITDILQNKTKVLSELVLNVSSDNGVDATLSLNNLNIGLTNQFYNDVVIKPIDATYNNFNDVNFKGRNYLCVFTSNPDVAQDNITINLVDNNEWEVGQLVTIVLPQSLDLNGKSVSFYTDKHAKFTTTSMGLHIGDMQPTTNEIKIVCIDKNNYEFIII